MSQETDIARHLFTSCLKRQEKDFIGYAKLVKSHYRLFEIYMKYLDPIDYKEAFERLMEQKDESIRSRLQDFVDDELSIKCKIQDKELLLNIINK